MSETTFPTGRVVTLQSTGIDTLLVTGVAAGTATLVFIEGTVQSQTVAITVGSTGSADSILRYIGFEGVTWATPFVSSARVR
jgi:hypothetical protein